MKLEEAVPDPALLTATIAHTCSNCWGSVDHGDGHWRRVAAAGLRLLPHVPDADPAVVYLFAAFHDSERLTDHGDDQHHGPRASVFATKLKGGPFDLTAVQMSKLIHACNFHTFQQNIEDPTIGVCYDADRLNLYRVLKYPDPYYFSTEEAKKNEVIEWGVSSLLSDDCLSWVELYEEYVKLDGGS